MSGELAKWAGPATQYACRGCGSIVIVPTHALLTVTQQMALQRRVCRDCLGPIEVKAL
jgi:hypothetical protein